MSEHDPSVEHLPGERKFFSKHKWRGKLFTGDDKIAKSQKDPPQPADDLVDFLQGPARSRNDTVGSESRTGDPGAGVPSASNTDSVTSSRAGYQRRKDPRRKGLRVAFNSAPPDIIGEGGDEAELPSINVAQSRSRAQSLRQSQNSASKLHTRRSSPPPQTELVVSQEPRHVSQVDDRVEPPPLQRRSMGFHDSEQASAGHEAPTAHDTTNTAPIQQQKWISSPNDSEAFAAMYAEYTHRSPSSPRVVVDQSSDQPGSEGLIRREDIEDFRDYSSLKASSPEFDPSSGNSLTPIPSPRPFSGRDRAPADYDFPATNPSKSPESLPWRTKQANEAHTEGEGQLSGQITLNPTMISPPLASPPSLTPSLKSPQKTLRAVAKNLGGDALNEFTTRVQRFYGIFRLGENINKSPQNPSFEDWIRTGAWWFLKGRSELENAVRRMPGVRDRALEEDEREVPAGLKQAYLNLAKSSWITADVTIGHVEVRKYGSGSMTSLLAITKSFGDSKVADLIEVHLAITASLRALTMSMKRNGKMPPPDFEAQGLDTRIWIETPRFASKVASLLHGTSSRSLLEDGSNGPSGTFPFPIGDTKSHFNYGTMFVDVRLRSSDDPEQGVHMPCGISILRLKNERDLEVVLASLDGKVNLKIQSNRRGGQTWRDVHWRTDAYCMVLRLSDTLELDIQFQESSFRTLWGIYDFTRKIRKSLEATEEEEIVFKSTVKCVHYVDTPDAKAFPVDPVQRCDVLLFEQSLTLAEGSGRRRFHSGHRLAVLTPPSSKTLSNISQHLGKQVPILFNYVRGDDGGPAILVKSSAAGSTIVITFDDPAEREHFLSRLNGNFVREEELCNETIPLQSMLIYDSVGDESQREKDTYVNSLHWDKLRVINRRPEYSENGISKTVLSDNLRIWVHCEAGTLVDRINLGPGELQLSLSTDLPAQITLLRLPQQDMSVTFESNKLSTSKAKALSESVIGMSLQPTLRVYRFSKLQDLHLFQRRITGFSALYDGFASNFSISRRRMVVPIHKKWEANVARLQIVQLDRVLQLVAYFKDFPYGTCMTLVLKTTDNFESLTRSEQYCIRIVDAKFALPKRTTEKNHDFICLDMPEYPSEHDDITIGFESEADGLGASNPMPDLNGYKEAPQPGVADHAASTLTLHADDHLNRGTDVAPPIHLSTTFRYASDPSDLVPAAEQDHTVPTDAHVYSRHTAPNTTRLETLLTPLLSAPCLTYSSGLAALHAFYVFLRPERVSVGAGYHGSRGVLGLHEKLHGMKVLPLDCPAEELQKGDVIHLETPVNPTGEARHIATYAEKAHSRGAILLVDATFGPPGLQEPFQWGADVVMHSGTKYIGGHSDILMGVLSTRREDWLIGLRQERVYLGSVMGSLEGWLGLRSLRTLTLRVKTQSENAGRLVNWLDVCLNGKAERQDEVEAVRGVVEKVQHASLQHEDMDWLKKQMPNGFGPVFAIWMKEEVLAKELPSKLELFSHATSLGGVESLIEWRAMSDEDVDRRLVRVSVGLEGWDDLKKDFVTAFRRLKE